MQKYAGIKLGASRIVRTCQIAPNCAKSAARILLIGARARTHHTSKMVGKGAVPIQRSRSEPYADGIVRQGRPTGITQL